MLPPAALIDPGTSALTPIAELTLPAVLLRDVPLPENLVSVYLPSAPTVAFTARDLRSPGIVRATAIARENGFVAAVRSPGGKMVAYDAGAVVVDHLAAASAGAESGSALFAQNAAQHARVLAEVGRAVGGPELDTRVGEVPGEYCPGEFSVNVGGVVKVLGSAQRIVRQGSLFSTVIQVSLSPAVREVITEVSAALGYDLAAASMGGLADFAPGLSAADVAAALRTDYRARFHLVDTTLPEHALAAARAAAEVPPADLPFHVDDWTRAHPARA